jgi:hypothetical protein
MDIADNKPTYKRLCKWCDTEITLTYERIHDHTYRWVPRQANNGAVHNCTTNPHVGLVKTIRYHEPQLSQ